MLFSWNNKHNLDSNSGGFDTSSLVQAETAQQILQMKFRLFSPCGEYENWPLHHLHYPASQPTELSCI